MTDEDMSPEGLRKHGFVEGAVVRHYIGVCKLRYDDATIKQVQPYGGLLVVRKDGELNGWSPRMCSVVHGPAND